MPGFDNNVVYANNVDFTGNSTVAAQMTTDGQLLVGSTTAPNIRVATLTSTDSSIAITNGHGTINLATPSSIPTTFSEDSGTASPSSHTINIHGGTSSGGAATNVNTIGSGSTVSVCLNNSISQPNTNNTGTTGMYSLGGNSFMHKYGTGNAFLGEAAGNLSLTGTSQTGIGANALQNISSGTHNTAVGQGTLYTMTTGNHNTFLGTNAGEFLPIGEHNIGIGDSALYGGVTSDPWYCTAVGNGSQQAITTGYSNTSVGYGSLSGNTTGTDNVAIGNESIQNSTTSGSCVGVGSGSLKNCSGNNHTAVGTGALTNCTGSNGNTAVGSAAMNTCSGSSNTAVGDSALYTCSGDDNTAIGTSCLSSLTTGYNNTFAGWTSGDSLTSGSINTAFGDECLNLITTGSNNIGVGYYAGHSYTSSESNNIAISNVGVIGESNVIRIGSQGSGSFQQNACYVAGIASVSVSNKQMVTIDTTTGQLGSQAISGGGFSWQEVTSATNPNALVASNGYIAKGAGVVQFILPATAAVGDMFWIVGYGNLWTLKQNALQSITLGSNTSTVGILGSITATNIRDCVNIICVVANTEFQIIDSIGNITFA